LWNLDLALADIVSTSTDPRLGEIRLAWWRERLDDLDSESPAAGEPRLGAIHRHLMTMTNGATLSELPIAWAPLLYPFPWGADVADGLRERGRLLFGIGAQILGNDGVEAEAAGALWSLVDGAEHCSDKQSRDFLLGEAKAAIAEVPRRMPREVRPLTVLAALAAHDLFGSNRLSRVAAAAAHRLWGTMPRG
jgi:phytoene synthase